MVNGETEFHMVINIEKMVLENCALSFQSAHKYFWKIIRYQYCYIISVNRLSIAFKCGLVWSFDSALKAVFPDMD